LNAFKLRIQPAVIESHNLMLGNDNIEIFHFRLEQPFALFNLLQSLLAVDPHQIFNPLNLLIEGNHFGMFWSDVGRELGPFRPHPVELALSLPIVVGTFGRKKFLLSE